MTDELLTTWNRRNAAGWNISIACTFIERLIIDSFRNLQSINSVVHLLIHAMSQRQMHLRTARSRENIWGYTAIYSSRSLSAHDP